MSGLTFLLVEAISPHLPKQKKYVRSPDGDGKCASFTRVDQAHAGLGYLSSWSGGASSCPCCLRLGRRRSCCRPTRRERALSWDRLLSSMTTVRQTLRSSRQ